MIVVINSKFHGMQYSVNQNGERELSEYLSI